MLTRQRCRRLLLTGFATRPRAMHGRFSHVVAGIAYCPRVGPPYRVRRLVCVSTSSLSSSVIDGFDTLPHSTRGLSSHVVAVIVCYCRVSGPFATTIAVGNVHTDCPRIGPAIARDEWLLARHRYRRLSLTGSTPCRARARCLVCVSTSSLSSLVSGVFDTPPRSRAKCRLC